MRSGILRHCSSGTVVHHAAKRHGCFRAGKPTTPAPPTPEVPAFVTVVLGSAGQSCFALCQSAGRQCAQEHLAALNNCNILRQHFACEAGWAAVFMEAYVIQKYACIVVQESDDWQWPVHIHASLLDVLQLLLYASVIDCRCEAEASAMDAPAYVEASAPKQQRPTMCLTQDMKSPAFSCDAAQANQQRLCACQDNAS